MGASYVSSSLYFQSTLPVWGVTRGVSVDIALTLISIHTPRVGSDNTSH